MEKIKFPQYISTNKRTVSIVGCLIKDDPHPKDYINMKGYVDEDGSIWIYSDNEPKNKNAYPYFWIKDGKIVRSNPPEIIRKAFTTENMKDLSLLTIIDTTDPNEQLYDEQEIADMNSSASFYVPIINKEDDFLKKVVKNTIIQKGIDINRLKGKTGHKYILPNMKAALQNKTKMSTFYFCYWMDLLGCDFEVTVSDNGTDNKDPLKNPIIYKSYDGKTCKIVNNELIELNNTEIINDDENEESSEEK